MALGFEFEGTRFRTYPRLLVKPASSEKTLDARGLKLEATYFVKHHSVLRALICL